MRERERFVDPFIYIYIYFDNFRSSKNRQAYTETEDKCDCYLIRRGFDRELMHAINMKIIVYGVCVCVPVENKLPKIYSRNGVRGGEERSRARLHRRTLSKGN